MLGNDESLLQMLAAKDDFERVRDFSQARALRGGRGERLVAAQMGLDVVAQQRAEGTVQSFVVAPNGNATSLADVVWAFDVGEVGSCMKTRRARSVPISSLCCFAWRMRRFAVVCGFVEPATRLTARSTVCAPRCNSVSLEDSAMPDAHAMRGVAASRTAGHGY